MSFHNYSSGKNQAIPIGDGSAIMPLKNGFRQRLLVQYITAHRKKMLPDKIAGHAMFLGATGTGKQHLKATASGFFNALTL